MASRKPKTGISAKGSNHTTSSHLSAVSPATELSSGSSELPDVTSTEASAEEGGVIDFTQFLAASNRTASRRSDSIDRIVAPSPYFSLNRSLQRAINEGKKQMVKMVLEEFPPYQVQASINEWNESGYSPIHIAAIEGHPKIIKLLVDRGADPNLFSRDEETPVFLASM